MNIKAVGKALGNAVTSQFHPKMLALLLGPFLLSIFIWAGVAWLVWDPLTLSIGSFLFDGGLLGKLNAWLASVGMPAPKSWLPKFMTFMLVLPLMFVSAVVLTSLLAMPVVIRHLQKNGYSDVARTGSFAVATSLSNSVGTLLMFTVGYICTIPLWFIPPLIFVVPLLWWAWLNSRILRLDSLLEHASAAEAKQLITKNKGDYRLLGLAVAALNYIPPLFVVAPVFGALAFAHYSLDSLRSHRKKS
jgi:Etoposide-induced protein 2.4 (EI24)